jgi:hypothetical protein
MAASPVNRPRNARESDALCAQSQCGRALDESEPPAFSVKGKLRK